MIIVEWRSNFLEKSLRSVVNLEVDKPLNGKYCPRVMVLSPVSMKSCCMVHKGGCLDWWRYDLQELRGEALVLCTILIMEKTGTGIRTTN
ncbi:hypothetical protein Goari_022225, partial [Gossypium aridum]|nr:hypothetical protein [Gossypium aridum]